jgi:DNA-binding NarL/FixJ family response regulator
MTAIKSHKQPISGHTNRPLAKSATPSDKVSNLQSLLNTPPKLAVIQSRETVAANKSDILKALRRGHRIKDIAHALSMPIRTFTRRLKEQDISVRSVRKQYQRSA